MRTTPWETLAKRPVRRAPEVSSDRPGGVRWGRRAGNHAKGGEKCLKVQGNSPAKHQVRIPRSTAARRALTTLRARAAPLRARPCLTGTLPSRTRPAKRRKTSRSSYRSSAPGRGSLPGTRGAVEGIDAVRAFYREFFDRNVELHHVWKAKVQPDGLHFARWAVAGRRSSDEVFALSGCDVAEMDDVGRILKLRVEID